MGNTYINYIEPNYNFGEKGRVEAVPLEDLCIAVDMCVEVPPIKYNGQVVEDGTTYVVTWNSRDKQTSMSFFHGTKNPNGEGLILSTDYTKATYADLLEGGTSELFGISSIEIKYDNYFTPQIVVEFVDVRGASLYGLEELRHPGVKGYATKDVAGSFFRSFFVQPWPRFTILVKGFYGQPVTYSVACQNFKAKFDSKTGNFKTTVTFIGYTYGFLGDILLSPLVATPHSPFYGQEYWENQCNLGRFQIDGGRMPTLTEILHIYKDLATNVQNQMEGSATQQALNATNERVQALEELQSTFNDIWSKYTSIKNYQRGGETAPTQSSFVEGTEESGEKNYVGFVQPLYISEGNVETQLTDDQALIDEYNAFVENCKELGVPESNIPNLEFTLSVKYSTIDGISLNSSSETFKQVALDNATAFIQAVDSKSVSSNGGPSDTYQENIGGVIAGQIGPGNMGEALLLVNGTDMYGFEANEKGFNNYISSAKSSASTQQTQQVAENNETQGELYARTLGFRPTVYNITKIIMAHVETYMYEISECHKRIFNTTRTAQNILQTGGSEFCAPFPNVLKETTNKDSNIKELELAWIGDVSNNSSEAYEKDLIEGLIKGLDELKKEIAYLTDETPQLSSSSSNANGDGTLPIRSIITSDVVNSRIWAQVNTTDIQSVINAILLRALGVIILGDDDVIDNLKAAGKEDATTLIKYFPGVIENLGEALNALNADAIITSGISNNVISKTDDDNEYSLKGNWLPYTHINTSDNSMLGANGIVTESQTPEYFVNLGDPTNNGKTKTYSVHTGDVVETFFRNSSINDETKIKEGISTTMENTYQDWYYQQNSVKGQWDVLVVKNFEDKGDIKVDFTPIEGNGLFDTSIDKVKANPNVFNKPSDVDWGNWVTQSDEINSLGFHAIRTNKGVLTRPQPNEFKKDCFTSYDGFLQNIDNYQIGVFNGVNFENDDCKMFKSCHGVSVFSQGAIEYYQNFKVKAYLFLESFIVHDTSSHIVGIDLDYGLENVFEDNKKVYTCPYVVVLYIGSLGRVDEEKCQARKKHMLTKVSSEFMEACGKEFDAWYPYFAKEIVPRYYLNLQSAGAVHTIGNVIEGQNATNIVNQFCASFQNRQSFFENYISFKQQNCTDSEKYKFTEKNNSLPQGFRLFNRQTEFNKQLTKNLFQPCVIVKYNPNIQICADERLGNINGVVEGDYLKEYLEGFISGLTNTENVAAALTLAEQTPATSSVANVDVSDGETDPLVKISLYQYTKAVYDKWLKGNIDNNPDIAEFATLENFFDKHFHFIDTFHNYATDVYINLQHFCEVLVQSNNQGSYSLVNFLGSIYGKGFGFFQTQNFMDYNDKELMESMFTPIPYLKMKRPSPTDTHIDFVVVKQNEVSHQLHMKDENGNDLDDGFMLGDGVDDAIIPIAITSKSTAQRPDYMSKDAEFLAKFKNANYVHKIPCFGVAYGKQYENFFIDIDVTTDNHVATNEALNAEMQILNDSISQYSGQQAENASNTKLQALSQDLFSVYMNNSYTCTVTMMGCAWVQPMMYFCLTNVPMFRGCYYIIRVSHSIKPGQMLTKFTGVRMSRTSLPHVDKLVIRTVGDATLNNFDNAYDGYSEGDERSALANIDNDCGYKYFSPFVGSGNGIEELKDFDFMKKTKIGDILPTNPYPKQKWWDRYKNETIYDYLVTTIIMEYGAGSDLSRELVAVTFYNRFIYNGLNWKKFMSGMICDRQYAPVTKNAKADDGINDYFKKKTSTNKAACESALEKIFNNSPTCLIGKKADPGNSKTQVTPWSPKQRTTSAAKELTEFDLKYVYYFGTYSSGWANLEREDTELYKPYYLFQEQDHVFGTSQMAINVIDRELGKLNASGNSNTSQSQTQVSEEEKLKALASAIKKTVAHSTTIGFGSDEVKYKIRREYEWNYLILNVEGKREKNAILFDIVYNTYYDNVLSVMWIAENQNSVKGNCLGVAISITRNTIGKGSMVSQYELASRFIGLDFNDNYFKALAKRYHSKGLKVEELKSIPDDKSEEFKKIMEQHKPSPCPEPSLGGDGGDTSYEPIQIPSDLPHYKGGFPYKGSPFTEKLVENKTVYNKTGYSCKANGRNVSAAQIQANVHNLVAHVLHPLYYIVKEEWGIEFFVTSSAVRSGTYDSGCRSHHKFGEAVDGHGTGYGINDRKVFDSAYRMLKAKPQLFDELYFEAGTKCPDVPGWVHIGIPNNASWGNGRKRTVQIDTATKDEKKKGSQKKDIHHQFVCDAYDNQNYQGQSYKADYCTRKTCTKLQKKDKS